MKAFQLPNIFTAISFKEGVCGFVLEWKVMKYNTTSRCRASCLPQDKSFKSDRNTLSQTTLKTCLLPKWIWGERNKIFEAGPVIRRL